MQEEQVKAEIQKIVTDFRIDYEKHKEELEANTETKLVEPLFKALGWTIKDFIKREHAGRGGKKGFADYAFKINDKTVFFLEVKKIGVDLEKEANKQVKSYALSKRIPFAVSTNFEELNIFCVEYDDAQTQTFRTFSKPEKYIENLDNLMLLSKKSFEDGTTLSLAEEENRLKKRVSMDKIFLEDLMQMRTLLIEDVEKNHSEKYDLNEKEEIVQRIIDRLIFIRYSEDEGINPDNLSLKTITELPHNEAYPKLKNYFKEYNEVYNSGLFEIGVDNDCDKIKIDGEIIKKLINQLYDSKDNKYIYKFGKEGIDADVLGQVYEQYLGRILRQTKAGKAKLKEGQAHKKEQGIYYTPTYVVDYIVKNTLCEVLKDKKIKANELNILDPACGSGSFLIKAFDYLYSDLLIRGGGEQHKWDKQGTYSLKTEILKKNLYGVDLDNKAVEITKLSLLLKAAEKGRKLPEEIDLHIKRGNSIIDDAKVAGELIAFKWEDKFQNLIQFDEKNELKEGKGFDVIIGNPPYDVIYSNANQKEFKFYKSKEGYISAEYNPNLFALFIEKSLCLLKDGGILGFIIPSSVINNQYFGNLRKLILDNTKIIQIYDVKKDVFKDANVDTCIIILKKELDSKARDKNKLIFLEGKKDAEKLEIEKTIEVSQSKFKEEKFFSFNVVMDKEFENIQNKLLKNSLELGEIAEVYRGMVTRNNSECLFDTKKNEKYKPVLSARDIGRYSLSFGGKYIFFDKSSIGGGCWNEKVYLADEKLLVQLIRNLKLARRIVASYDNEQFYILQNMNNIIVDKKSGYSPKYVLGIINSKVINYWFKKRFLDINIKRIYIKQILIKKANNTAQEKIISLVNELLLLNKKYVQFGEKQTAETKDLNEKIEMLNKKIDQEVYLLYGLTDKEIELIEKS